MANSTSEPKPKQTAKSASVSGTVLKNVCKNGMYNTASCENRTAPEVTSSIRFDNKLMRNAEVSVERTANA